MFLCEVVVLQRHLCAPPPPANDVQLAAVGVSRISCNINHLLLHIPTPSN